MKRTQKEKNIDNIIAICYNSDEFKKEDLSEYNYVVESSDSFMSGWGMAQGKVAKSLVLCKTKEQALICIEKMDQCFKYKKWYNINYEDLPIFEKYEKVIYTLRIIDHCHIWR